MRLGKRALAVVALTAAAALLTGCASGSSGGSTTAASSGPVDGTGKTLTLWDFESDTSAMGIAWNEAIKVFEKETGAKVKFEAKSFEQIRSTASQVLNSDQAPDILEYNKGNATAGLLASQGLLSNLDGYVSQYGWDAKLAPSLQTTAKYDENGIMGSGSWYGVPNYGEFVEAYYNKDMFAKYNVAIPTTQAEFEAALKTFKDAGITPLSESAAEYPLGQLWYQLALTKADRSFVNDYQLYTGDVDWQGKELTYATNTIKDWTDKGYISKDATGTKAEDAGTAFIAGTNPIFFSGSWWYNRFTTEIKGFNFGTFLYPGATMSPGSSGNMWVVPEKAKNKDLAAAFIDITMRPEIQALIGNNGGVPVAANAADITDPKSQELIANFNTLTARDGIGFYPDWPTPTFYDQLNAGLQELMNGTKSSKDVLSELGTEYNDGIKDIKK
ncbi:MULTISPECIES: extracellular solute-binding protein [unclassified Cryobacterium]|uniref:extracellular solute-binding protein n=1 Tax=unclassified Cryobacterium TaxID=2649013 RepID=UPI002AB5468A|nr:MULTISPECIES: extracellular solute-binding protein [unclassified Cryobacterium]MDY7541617.1 extracellular solute-binding protein [Cryobacterium sp. 5B3]MEB0000948.1 extracellular solute-binding protein [Cryobacterium sp. RTS3]MEB0265515.1 extracellular solute-binding protein [Cryobacterium sp. 10I5]MEB0276725.1 extracellular solute-binding protein [Cryobacterium sp. 5B3]